MFEVGTETVSNWQAPAVSLLSPSRDRKGRRKKRRRADGLQDETLTGVSAAEDVVLGPHDRHSTLTPFRLRVVLCGMVVMLACSLALGVIKGDRRNLRVAFSNALNMDAVAGALGFGIDQVAVTGQRYTFDRDIFDALDLANVRSFLRLDARAVKARIERLPWVATAELTRVFPNRLDIRVSERKPFALWTRGEKSYLIDDTGRVLTAVSGALPPDLPRVAGEGAATEASALMTLMDRYPGIRKRLEVAERIGERRWVVKISPDLTLDLPADGEARVLQDISSNAGLAKLVERGNATLDFRTPGRVAMRSASETRVQDAGAEPRS